MSERGDIHAEFTRSPRVIVIEKNSKELTMQDLVDTLKGIIEKSWNGLDEPVLHSSGGKEALDAETDVGITVTLQNAQIAFEARNTSISFATATADDSNGTLLTDTNANFVTDGVVEGDTIVNFTDLSVATVVEVVSPTQLSHYKLADGTNNDWNIGDTYKVFHVAQCIINGGNLVAIDDVGSPISAISPTAFTQIVLTKSSSATLADLSAIQYASYNGAVTIDAINGVNGTAYNIGTPENPVKNLADAQIIAAERGFNKLYIVGDFTFGASENIDNYQIEGQNPILSAITITDGCSTEGTEFSDCTTKGTLSGEVELSYLVMDNISGFYGTARKCFLKGTIKLGGTSNDMAQFSDCKLGTILIGLAIIDMNGDAAGLAMRPYTGGIKITNKSGASKVAIDFLSGRIELTDTVTAGTFFIRGVGEITKNEATGITLYADPLINPAVVVDQVWDEAKADHISAGSTGEVLTNVTDGISRILGLSRENMAILNTSFNPSGLPTAGTVKLYPSKTDCLNDTNPIDDYSFTASYNVSDELISFKMVKN